MTIPIYNTQDIDTTTADTAASATTTAPAPAASMPTIHEQLTRLNNEHSQDIDNITRNYNDYIHQLSQSNNPYDAILATVRQRQLHDPRVTKARQALGSLYDAFQIIGSAAAMAAPKNATPPSPAISSAAAKQNDYAHRIRLMQLQEDDNFHNALRNITQRKAEFENSRNSNIARLQQQQQQDINKASQFFIRQRNNIISKENDRKSRERNAIIRADTQLKAAQTRRSSVNSQRQDRSKVLDYNNVEYTLPVNKEKDFSAAVGNLMKTYHIDKDDFTNTGLSGISLHMAVLKSILEDDILQDNTHAYTKALNILNTYFIHQELPQSVNRGSSIQPYIYSSDSDNDLGWQ